MATWAKIQRHPEIRNLYGAQFPIELRHYFAHWIEAQPWDALGADPSRAKAYAELLENMLEQKIKSIDLADDSDSFLLRLRLEEIAGQYRNAFGDNPVLLANTLARCLQREREHMAQLTASSSSSTGGSAAAGADSPRDPEALRIAAQLESLQGRVAENESELRAVTQQHESLVIRIQEISQLEAFVKQLNAAPGNAQGRQHEQLAKKRLGDLKSSFSGDAVATNARTDRLVAHIGGVLADIAVVQGAVIEGQLSLWRLEQRRGLLCASQSEDAAAQLGATLSASGMGVFSGADGNGAQAGANATHLSNIQEWCEAIAGLTWRSREHAKEAKRIAHQVPLIAGGVEAQAPRTVTVGGVVAEARSSAEACGLLLTEASRLLGSLVASSFVVEVQPPQVLRTQSKFSATVRLLGAKALGIHVTPPEVVATIVSEQQAREALSLPSFTVALNATPSTHGDSSAVQAFGNSAGDILNNRKTFDSVGPDGAIRVDFKNMSLKKIKRKEGGPKGDGEHMSVTEEKFAILFQSRFTVGGGQLCFCVRALSLPIVVIVHGNQLPSAQATILWDNAFADVQRVPFEVPLEVPWASLAAALNSHFAQASSRLLSENDLDYLGHKLADSFFGHDRIVSRHAVVKDALPGRDFTFWEWFYGCEALVARHLQGPFVDGLILGFCNKQQAQDLLSACPNGTFLLRFSDSEVGGITVAWIAEDEMGIRQVWNLQPWFAKDFAIRSLADRIHDLPQLQVLFPDRPKDIAFGQYYTPLTATQTKPGTDYVRSTIAAVIPGSVPSVPVATIGLYDPSVFSYPLDDLNALALSLGAGAGGAFVPGAAGESSHEVDFAELLRQLQQREGGVG